MRSSRQSRTVGEAANVAEPKDAAVPQRRGDRTPVAELTPKRPPEVVVVDCGSAANYLYRPALMALERAGEVVVRAAVDRDQLAPREFLEGFSRGEPYSSLEAVTLAPDALVILTSAPRYHTAQATAAFKRGWHVLCHPPLATSSREGALMVAAAQRHERMLGVTLHRRLYPALRYLRTLCRDHLLGPLLSFSIEEGGTSDWPVPAAILAPGRFEAPDGVLAESGVHTLDLLSWCLGGASILNYCDDAMGGVEANSFVEVSFADGARGTIHLSRDWPTTGSYAFVFERGIVRWNIEQADNLTVQLANAPAALSAHLVTPIAATDPHTRVNPLSSKEQSFIAHLQNVIAAVAGKKALLVSATDAMQSVAMIEECYARRTVIEQPWLTHNEAVHARVLAPPSELRRP